MLKSYGEILEFVKESKKIYELAMNPEKIKNIKRLKEAGDLSGILKKLQEHIDIIVDHCKKLNYDEIKYFNKNGTIEINYRYPIITYLATLKELSLEGGEEIDKRLFGGRWSDIYLQIDLDDKLLNRIDIINSLPNFMKNIGLGKKIYKKLIKDFGYISSFYGYEPSIDSSMVWNSLSRDSDIFIFSNDDNLISFWNEIGYDDIMDTLKIFYKDKGFIQIDDDFIKKYNIVEEEFIGNF